MATETYKVLNGLSIFANSSVLSGTGAPGGDSSFQDAAELGSIFLRKDAPAAVYVKTSSVNSSADWVPLQVSSGGGGNIAPVNAADTTPYASIAAATTAYNSSNTVDGISITSGFRILLANPTTGAKTAYDVTGSAGAWTLTPDATIPATGDEIYVESGVTYAGDIFAFDGTNWNLESGETVVNELAFIRTFIGKAASGNVTPTYSSTNFVTNGTSLEVAIGAIDNGIKNFGRSVTASNVTTVTTVDSINCRAYDAVKWFIVCIDHSSPGNKQTAEIFAGHDGTPSIDASNVDFNLSSLLSINTAPTGLTFTVTLTGTGASQVMNLRVSSTTAVDVKVTRITV
jgi:hypothetical protein